MVNRSVLMTHQKTSLEKFSVERNHLFLVVKNPNDFEIVEYIPFKVVGDHTEKYPMDKGGVVFYRFDGKTEKLKRPFHF